MFKDSQMENMIKDIIDIFNMEGVNLVRLSGLLNREKQILQGLELTPEILDSMLRKLKNSGVINYKFITSCPHCREVSYQIVDVDISKPKLCDTCKTLYTLIDGTTLTR